MTYIDPIAHVRATGPSPCRPARPRSGGSPAQRWLASAAGPRPTGTDRLLPAQAMETWLVR
jgi:hypothetical protein